jgi:Protein of unknown function (DUF2892)
MYPFDLVVRLWGSNLGGDMQKNVGTIDRIIRVAIALAAVIGAGVVGFGSLLGIVLLVVAVVMVATAAVGWCPLYRILGLSTFAPSSPPEQNASANL